MEKNNQNNIKRERVIKHTESPFFNQQHVKEFKQKVLKTKLKTLIHAKGMKESDFYNKLQISGQLWYYISWAIWEPSDYLKVKIAKELETDSSIIFGDIDYSKITRKLREPRRENMENGN